MKKSDIPPPPVVALDVPQFASESEEADWYATHPEVIAKAFQQAKADGLPIRRSDRVAQAGDEKEAANVTIRMKLSEVERAKRQAERRGMRYQTYIKMLLHEALDREEARP